MPSPRGVNRRPGVITRWHTALTRADVALCALPITFFMAVLWVV